MTTNKINTLAKVGELENANEKGLRPEKGDHCGR
jgi:hypothetical protein